MRKHHSLSLLVTIALFWTAVTASMSTVEARQRIRQRKLTRQCECCNYPQFGPCVSECTAATYAACMPPVGAPAKSGECPPEKLYSGVGVMPKPVIPKQVYDCVAFNFTNKYVKVVFLYEVTCLKYPPYPKTLYCVHPVYLKPQEELRFHQITVKPDYPERFVTWNVTFLSAEEYAASTAAQTKSQ